MLTTIKLYGHLGQKFGPLFEFDIDTVAESIRALSANLAGFKQYLLEHSDPGYRVLIDEHPLQDVDEIGLGVNRPSVIKIIPVVQGAADGKSIGMIVFGVVLVAAAFFTGGTSLLGLSATASSSIVSAAAGMGLSMIAGGISGLLSPVPAATDAAKQSNNTGFGNGQDTISQGLKVPIGYGRMLCEGYPISVRVVVEHD